MRSFSRFAITPNRTVKVFFSAAIFLVLAYFAWQLYPIFRAPLLVIFEPDSFSTVSNAHIVLRGSTEQGARLTVNRQQVYVEESGNFSQPMLLASGVNVIDITAEGRFGRRTKVTRYVMYNSL
ncbi:MAG: hypothetical protein Q7S09_01640 [bacterium]|nr:hypothetical protein [bacterium]